MGLWLGSRKGFAASTIADLTLLIDQSAVAASSASRRGLLQKIDPRVKLLGALMLIVNAAASTDIRFLAGLLVGSFILILITRLPITPVARLWLGAGLFSLLLALPATMLTQGETWTTIPIFDWRITRPGMIVASRLVLRSLVTSGVAAILLLSTPWQSVLKALRRLKIPAAAVMLIGMTYRYIFVLLETSREMMEARRLRTVSRLPLGTRQRLMVTSAAVLFERSIAMGQEVHLAMLARGYRGEVHVLDDMRFQSRDWLLLSAILLMQIAILAAQ